MAGHGEAASAHRTRFEPRFARLGCGAFFRMLFGLANLSLATAIAASCAVSKEPRLLNMPPNWRRAWKHGPPLRGSSTTHLYLRSPFVKYPSPMGNSSSPAACIPVGGERRGGEARSHERAVIVNNFAVIK